MHVQEQTSQQGQQVATSNDPAQQPGKQRACISTNKVPGECSVPSACIKGPAMLVQAATSLLQGLLQGLQWLL